MPSDTKSNAPKHPFHCVDTLREFARQNSRRDFVARGANAERCPSCLMAVHACFCDKRETQISPIYFTLLFHYTEIHKPTNSGRLIADVFPEQTDAFIWSRTEPDAKLMDRLSHFGDNNLILFPETNKRSSSQTHRAELPENGSPLNIIVLDATWRLASKMLHQSRWLDPYHTFSINDEAQRSFKVRHAKHDNQFATAEVVAMLLAQTDAKKQSAHLQSYYEIFNEHSLWSRRRHLTP